MDKENTRRFDDGFKAIAEDITEFEFSVAEHCWKRFIESGGTGKSYWDIKNPFLRDAIMIGSCLEQNRQIEQASKAEAEKKKAELDIE